MFLRHTIDTKSQNILASAASLDPKCVFCEIAEAASKTLLSRSLKLCLVFEKCGPVI